MIFLLFKPMDIEEKKHGEIALFQIEDFLLHELTPNGLITLMKGDEAKKFTNRYEVDKIDYTDNSKELQANMLANFGVYKNEIVTLTGDIIYTREDGFKFTTEEVSYERLASIATTKVPYIATMGKNSVKGTWLQQNNTNNKTFSKNIKAIYYIEESVQ
jgi:hypothetical protein